MKNNTPAFLQPLTEILQINSVKTDPVDDKPFGLGVFNALDYALNLAKNLGFETINYSNYVGEIVWGSGTPFAILCHLDVVPVGNEKKWKRPPFSAEIDNGEIYARGAIDDKGPFIATLFALKKLKDEGFLPKKEIRLILGCDEESGWGCIDHYKTVRELPKIGFSPDASFPVIYAEKGIIHADFYFDYDKTKLFDISGGIAPNVVCDYATAKAEIDNDLIKKYNLKVNCGLIESFGVTAHASTPDVGINALNSLFAYLTEINAVNRAIHDFLFEDILKLKTICDETGALTMSPNVVKIEGDKLVVTVDFRYPSTKIYDEIFAIISKISKLKIQYHHKPLFVDKNSHLIKTLNSVYEKHTGEKSTPIAIGGGTYARALSLGAGFGPELPGEENLCHQVNERISIDKMQFLIDLYADAIKQLTILV